MPRRQFFYFSFNVQITAFVSLNRASFIMLTNAETGFKLKSVFVCVIFGILSEVFYYCSNTVQSYYFFYYFKDCIFLLLNLFAKCLVSKHKFE